MTAGLTSTIYAEGVGAVYAVDVLIDDDATLTGFTPWDRETVTGTATTAALLTVPAITYGELDIEAGGDVLPSFLTLEYDDPTGSVAAFFATYADDETGLLVRYRAVEGPDALDWFGRVRGAGRRRPVSRATKRGRVSVEVSCGLGDALAGVPAEPTTDVPLADLLAKYCFAANPHLPFVCYSDVSASNQYADGSGYTSFRDLRAAGEWAGPSKVAEGSGDTPAAASGDYGERREILDMVAAACSLRIFQDPTVGEWRAVPRSMLGEAIAAAEVATYAPAVDGGPTWDAPGVTALAADLFAPTATQIRDADGDGLDQATRLAAITLDAGAVNLVRPGTSAPALGEGEARYQASIVLAADSSVRLDLDALLVSSEVGSGTLRSAAFDVPPGILVYGYSGGTAYSMNAAGAWSAGLTRIEASTSGQGAAQATGDGSRPALDRVYIGLMGPDEYSDTGDWQTLFSGPSGSGEVELRLVDAGGVDITVWRFAIGDAATGGDVEEAETTPDIECDTDGAGTWATASGYASARWAESPSYLVEYGAGARLRLRATRLDVLDGAVRGLHGPGTVLSLDLDDPDGADDRAPYVVGAGLVVDPGAGWTRGVWHALTTDAQAIPDTTAPAVPTGLSATAGDSTVALAWTEAADPDLASTVVYRGTVSGTLTELATVAAGTETYDDNTAVNGTTYYYAVSSRDAAGNESAQTAEQSATPAPLYTYEVFTSSGTWDYAAAGSPATVDVLVVSGGGGGGSFAGFANGGGGGGAGGVKETTGVAVAGNVTVTVGAGGTAGSSGRGGPGGASSFGATATTGGGGGAGWTGSAWELAATGGSGGGGAGASGVNSGAAGTSGQGTAGGDVSGGGAQRPAAGGGGKGAAGTSITGNENGGAGGAGITLASIGWDDAIAGGAPSAVGGGGGGGRNGGTAGAGGTGGGGAGASAGAGTAGTANTGGGGGGAGGSAGAAGGAGGSGLVIVRYS